MKRAPLALFLLSWVLLSPIPSQAAEPTQPPDSQPTPTQIQAARELFNAARKDEEALRWADALEKLERVAAVKQTASVRYHIALCEEKMGRTASALSQYVEALDAAEEEHNKDVADLLKNAFLADLRARVPRLTLELPADVTGAEVKLDEHIVPPNQWRVAVPVDPGAHHIEARAPGRAPFSKDFVLHEREVTVLEVPLQSTAVAAAAHAAPHAEIFATTPPRSEASTSPRRSIALPLAAGVGALVLAGGGVGAYVAAGSAQSQGLQECPTRTNCDSLKATVHTWDDLALGAWIGAGVLGAAAVVLWALPTRSAQVRLTASPMRVQLEGSF